jgi:hypothetical protein
MTAEINNSMVATKETHLNLTVHLDNYEYMHKLMTDNYVNAPSEADGLIKIMEAALDFGMLRLADDVKADLRTHNTNRKPCSSDCNYLFNF